MGWSCYARRLYSLEQLHPLIITTLRRQWSSNTNLVHDVLDVLCALCSSMLMYSTFLKTRPVHHNLTLHTTSDTGSSPIVLCNFSLVLLSVKASTTIHIFFVPSAFLIGVGLKNFCCCSSYLCRSAIFRKWSAFSSQCCHWLANKKIAVCFMCFLMTAMILTLSTIGISFAVSCHELTNNFAT